MVVDDDDVLTIRIDDTLPVLVLKITDEDGNTIELDDVNDAVELFMRTSGSPPSDAFTIDGEAMSITDGPNGVVSYSWQSVDTDTKGVYEFWARITFANGTIRSFPQEDAFVLIIEDGTVMSSSVLRLRAKVGDRFQDNAQPFFMNSELEMLLDVNDHNIDRAAFEGWQIKYAAYAEFHDIDESGTIRKLSQKAKQAREALSFFEALVARLDESKNGRIVGKSVDLGDSDKDKDPWKASELPSASEYVRTYPIFRMRAILGSTVTNPHPVNQV